jgi:raffinose/stachyose/melibiose transport system permease protein
MIYSLLRRVFLIVFSVAVIIPVSIVVLGTFKTDFEIYSKPLALPKAFNLENFRSLIATGNVATPFKNSVIVSVSSVFLTLLFASLAAYAISRLFNVTGKVLFFLFTLGLAIPGQVNIVPIYTLFVKLNLTNSLVGLILVNIALNLPISIFILTAFLKDLPKEMFEVAGID